MKVLVVSGSQRTESQSAKVGEYIASVAKQFDQVEHIELYRTNLPLFDADYKAIKSEDSPWPAIEKQLKEADAYVFITPEWAGMASPLLKNMLLMCDQSYTGHKPALLVSVVAGINGAYPLAELRMNGFKNNKIVAIPDHVIVRHAADMLNSDVAEADRNEFDEMTRQRIEFGMVSLRQYADALAGVREIKKANPFPNEKAFGAGM